MRAKHILKLGSRLETMSIKPISLQLGLAGPPPNSAVWHGFVASGCLRWISTCRDQCDSVHAGDWATAKTGWESGLASACHSNSSIRHS